MSFMVMGVAIGKRNKLCLVSSSTIPNNNPSFQFFSIKKGKKKKDFSSNFL